MRKEREYQNKIKLVAHGFQHITKNCQTYSSLQGVENYVEDLIVIQMQYLTAVNEHLTSYKEVVDIEN